MKYIVTESQLKLLIEDNSEETGMSLRLRRRLADSLKYTKQDLEWYVNSEIDPCQYSSVGEFIAEACDYLKDLYLDNIRDIKVSPQDKDALYHYFVDNYGSLLYKIHSRRCVGGNLTEDHSDKFKKYLFNYLNNIDLVKKKIGQTSFRYLPKDASDEYEWVFMVWNEDYIDENGEIVTLRRLDVDPKLYFTIAGLFNIPEKKLNELIINWFNQTYNETVNDFILQNQD
jgi:hypothetical protein